MKISTWNLQGNAYNGMCSTVAEAKSRMLNEGIDVFCLQETGFFQNEDKEGEVLLSNNSFTLTRDIVIGTKSRGILVNRYSLKYGTFNFRCSMSILVRAELDCNCHALIPSYPNTKTREVFGILVQDPIDGRQIAVYNIHAPSGNSAFAKAYFQYALTEIDKLVTQHNISNVVLIGDFNNNPSMTSEELKNAVTKLRYGIFSPYVGNKMFPTHNSGNCLDYCCANLEPHGIVVSDNAAFSDHLQVTFVF